MVYLYNRVLSSKKEYELIHATSWMNLKIIMPFI